MSSDEIVFADVSYREPRRLRRPDRDPSRACITYGVNEKGDLPIFLDHAPADRIERHALSDTSVELGGILLGWECVEESTGEPFVWITEALPARHYENSQASFTYTHESWAQITREREERFPDLDIVGWYHTHPDFGIFLSSHDLFIHHNFFAQPLQVAYVVDPIRQQRGCFQWRDNAVEPVAGVTLVDLRAQRQSLARFVSGLESLPSIEGGSTGLSPLLEAQLMAMLARPHTVASSSGGGNLAIVTGLIGALLGMLILAAGLWLNQLAEAVRGQSQALANLQQSVELKPDEKASARILAKEQVLDRLLADVQLDDGSLGSIRAAYQKAIEERDSGRDELEALATDKAALNALTTSLRIEQGDLEKELIAAREELGVLRSKDSVRALEAKINDLKAADEEKAILLAEVQAGDLLSRYNRAWYVAVAAVGLSLLLGLGLVWAIARGGGSSPEPSESRPRPLGD